MLRDRSISLSSTRWPRVLFFTRLFTLKPGCLARSRTSSLETIFWAEPDLTGQRLPQDLVWLKESLVNNRGLQRVGIFRVSGETKEVEEYWNYLNMQQFERILTCQEPIICANLICRWFRHIGELSDRPILAAWKPSLIKKIVSLNIDGRHLIRLLEDELTLKEQVVLSWLAELIEDVSSYESVNLMSRESMVTIFFPSLQKIDGRTHPEGFESPRLLKQVFHKYLMVKQGLTYL